MATVGIRTRAIPITTTRTLIPTWTARAGTTTHIEASSRTRWE